MDFGAMSGITFDDTDDTVKKERRFSVHDVKDEDNDIPFGQPDNEAMDNDIPKRIASVDDLHDDQKEKNGAVRKSSINSDSHKSENDENDNNVFIHENDINDNEEYANDQFPDDHQYNDDNEEQGSGPNEDYNAARDSKEATPENNNNNKNNKNDKFDTTHYRHPSLAEHENPATDDEDVDKDHGRYLSTLIHENVDSDYEMTPSDEQVVSNNLFSKNMSRLHDYWCHSSDGIAIEDDTDSKILKIKETTDSFEELNSHNVKGSVHEINNYTRPFMSKIEDNNKWDTVFGNGIISDTHKKYISNENGKFIEWIIEITKLDGKLKKTKNATAIIGISSDLLGESNNDSFSTVSNGFGFDNLGNILNGKGNGIKTDNSLQFESRDVVHIILDYSNPNNWIFYAKVGDIEEEDYNDLNAASKTGGVSPVFINIHPGSYRLAVSLYSQMDALVIESCRIHGNEMAEFYQELKSYSFNENKQENNDGNDDEKEKEKEKEKETNVVIQVNGDENKKDDDDEKKKEMEVITENIDNNNNNGNDDDDDDKKEKEKEKERDKDDIVEEKVIESVVNNNNNNNNKDESDESKTDKINDGGQDIKSRQIEVSPAPNNLLSPPPPQNIQQQEIESENENENENENEDSKQSEDVFKSLPSQRSVIVHSDYDDIEQTPEHHGNDESLQGDKIKIEQQAQIINDLKKEIQDIQKQNEEKQRLIDLAAIKEREDCESINKMEYELNEYKEKAQRAEERVNELTNNLQQKQEELQLSPPRKNSAETAKINDLTSENERLCHELKLAQERVKSLDNKKKEMQDKLNNVIESKMKLIISTSEEIDHYRKLIQQIAQNKLGCQLLSDFAENDNDDNNGYNQHRNGHKNGYY